MHVAIASRHGNIRPEAEEYVRRKAEKLLTYFERVTAIQVTVDFGKDRVSVDIVVDAEHRKDFAAEMIGEDVPSAFDGAMAKMEQQIRRYKERLQEHRRDRVRENAGLEGSSAEGSAPAGEDLQDE